MSDESMWVDRAQSAEARLSTALDNVTKLKEKVRSVMAALGAKERSDGSFDIDYEKFVTALGIDGALEVRRIIDEQYSLSGAAGEKPRMRVKASAA